jgi:hypothetical protein
VSTGTAIGALAALVVGVVTSYVLPELLRIKRTRRKLDGECVALLKREFPPTLVSDLDSAMDDVAKMLDPLATLLLAVREVNPTRSSLHDRRLRTACSRLCDAAGQLDVALGSLGWPSTSTDSPGEPPRGEHVRARVGPAVRRVQEAHQLLLDAIHDWEGR